MYAYPNLQEDADWRNENSKKQANQIHCEKVYSQRYLDLLALNRESDTLINNVEMDNRLVEATQNRNFGSSTQSDKENSGH